MKADLLIHGGTVIDPSTGISGAFDVAVGGGKITGVFKPGTAAIEAGQTLDASGSYVSPGFIDIHTHIYEGVPAMGVAPDRVGIDQGVTTVVDAGSSGAANFDDFVRRSIEPNKSRVYAWLNISAPGLVEGRSELADLTKLDPKEVLAVIERNRDRIIGIKARMSGSVVKTSGIRPLEIAKDTAREAGLPVMVHIGNAPPQLGDVLDLLEAGDVVTHAFHGKAGGILSTDGSLIPQAVRALERGVLFDVGHGSSSFSFDTMVKAKELGIDPYSISTDLYLENLERGPVYSLALTMTKLLAMGYSLEQVVAWSTVAPAKAIQRENVIGTLREGAEADITVFRLEQEPVSLTDSEGKTVQYDQQLLPQYTLRAGAIHHVQHK
ncbi:amidohydrolase/deacetylase family metallohydrolase [Paenibacillus chitinolyticus]|uniref:amidohydrolase/deacetylase family metallohydrolase n=1 Tax=Paenibacillus chitinolyticus TaxID=79263 RepID=UPI002DB90D85|nr:amidohydrolase/deacetylase family metallohydrolase [Paenibacillus chitinolyticus]MEC0247008.1 amidohydrolase/deacetylase family metallohydrolase [Paenibacillus chitinolyticus]